MEFLFASGQSEQSAGGVLAFLPFVLIMFIIYFLMIRPQTKRQKEKQIMRNNLKKGDKVITMGGIYGTVQGFKQKGKMAILKIDKNTNIELSKTAIVGLSQEFSDQELEQTN